MSRDWLERARDFRLPDDEEEDEQQEAAEGDELPCVGWRPVRCHYCGSIRKSTSAGRGSVRWHRCHDCGRPYKSIEI